MLNQVVALSATTSVAGQPGKTTPMLGLPRTVTREAAAWLVRTLPRDEEAGLMLHAWRHGGSARAFHFMEPTRRCADGDTLAQAVCDVVAAAATGGNCVLTVHWLGAGRLSRGCPSHVQRPEE